MSGNYSPMQVQDFAWHQAFRVRPDQLHRGMWRVEIVQEDQREPKIVTLGCGDSPTAAVDRALARLTDQLTRLALYSAR
jgi:hypothetical protein